MAKYGAIQLCSIIYMKNMLGYYLEKNWTLICELPAAGSLKEVVRIFGNLLRGYDLLISNLQETALLMKHR